MEGAHFCKEEIKFIAAEFGRIMDKLQYLKTLDTSLDWPPYCPHPSFLNHTTKDTSLDSGNDTSVNNGSNNDYGLSDSCSSDDSYCDALSTLQFPNKNDIHIYIHLDNKGNSNNNNSSSSNGR